MFADQMGSTVSEIGQLIDRDSQRRIAEGIVEEMAVAKSAVAIVAENRHRIVDKSI